MDVDSAKAELAEFSKNNPQSSIETFEGVEAAILRPWGDESIFLEIKESNPTLIDALNHLILPEQFTAIWHRDTKDFEIIYTAFPLLGEQSEVKERKFNFKLKSKSYVCEFAKSSDRLLAVARSARFTGPSTTDHRNLPSFKYFLDAKEDVNHDDHEDLVVSIADWSPTSFWVRCAEWTIDDVLEVIRHLNFYMSYYDSRSPRIQIYPAKSNPVGQQRDRYLIGKFPGNIVANELSSNLMHFWTASRAGDMFRRFLYCYQIMEFASYYFIEDNIRRAVKRTLITPHLQDEVDTLIVGVIDHIQQSKIWEGGKMEALLKEVVKPQLLWREIEKNKEYFTSNVDFDGGFQLKPFIVDKTSEEAFCHDWHTKFCHNVRHIRNALSHGKEQRMSSVIAPTGPNFASLQPWGELMAVAAGEVVVYYNATP